MHRLALASYALLMAWLACTPAGPQTATSSGQGAGGTPLVVTCQDDCAKKYPAGSDAYRALKTCLVCGACHDRCNPEVGGTCAGNEKGCSAMSASCGACIVSDCAAKQQPDTTFTGACAIEASACASKPECVAMNNCVVHCLASPPGTGGMGGMGAGGMGGGP